MNRAVISPPEASDAIASPSPPDWNMVPFDVGCARCGHDLHGLTEPICPGCELEFDWGDAVPIERLTCAHCDYHLYGLQETRCPECGNEFTWEEALAGYARRQRPLFEYWWRERPVRTLAHSWWLALRPWKLWRTLDIHDKPAATGLLVQVVVAVLLMAGSYAALASLFGSLIVAIERATGLTAGLGLPQGAGPWRPGRLYWGPWSPWSSLSRWYAQVLPSFLVWGAASYGALLLLRQSMKRCRVKNGHVLRVCCYSILPLALAPAVHCVAVLVLDVLATWFPGLEPYATPGVVTLQGLVIALWLCSTVSIALAYRIYLRMKHAWWVAFLTQGVAVLSMLCMSLVKW